MAKKFTEKGLFCGETGQSKIYRSGRVTRKAVRGILLDTGCSRTVVMRDLVPAHKYLEGDTITIKCAHGDILLQRSRWWLLECQSKLRLQYLKGYQWMFYWGLMCLSSLLSYD